jgi:hypothetical protein
VTLFFGGDMSLYEGLIARLEAEKPDIAMSPNGRDESRTARGIIGNITKPRRLSGRQVTPVPHEHWDLYDINGCGEEAILRAAYQAGARIRLSDKEFTAFPADGDLHRTGTGRRHPSVPKNSFHIRTPET